MLLDASFLLVDVSAASVAGSSAAAEEIHHEKGAWIGGGRLAGGNLLEGGSAAGGSHLEGPWVAQEPHQNPETALLQETLAGRLPYRSVLALDL